MQTSTRNHTNLSLIHEKCYGILSCHSTFDNVVWIPDTAVTSIIGSAHLKQSEELTLVNGFHAEHPPATQAVCSTWEQKGNYKCPERKMQKPTEKMLTDVQKEIASSLSISANVKADNADTSSTNSSFDI
ncbi:hypothetical protein llap_9970 [Limosa lapponica baueri]|uniref:Uncharacterized protein n=1 Tax=Limosa lapponica baueri TaxID=1758121 RepID=A0A2I0U127_LIMLA|nr:hypothetical protein llap_9970 [Limosa lapponica baueri]